MITDWYNHCKGVLKSHKLNEEETQMNSKYIQEIYFIRYLIGLNYNHSKIQNEWKSIENGTAKSFDYDQEEQLTFFEKQYKVAQQMGALYYIDLNCSLYKEEIDYINSLQAPLWFREYLLGILVLYKSMKKKYKYIEYSKKWCSWILKKCDNCYQFYRKSETINKWNRNCNFPIKFYPYDNKVYINFKEIKCKEENLITNDASLDNFPKFFNKLEEKTFVCTQCGAKMELNEHSKRTICLECWKKQEKNRIKKAVNRLRKEM